MAFMKPNSDLNILYRFSFKLSIVKEKSMVTFIIKVLSDFFPYGSTHTFVRMNSSLGVFGVLLWSPPAPLLRV